jgi:hypothetical protein
MLAYKQNIRAGEGCNLRTQQTKFPITDNSYVIGSFDRGSFKNSTGCGKRLSENCVFVNNLLGNYLKVHRRQSKKLCVCSIATNNAEYRSRGAVTRITRPAKVTLATACVDFADNSPANKRVVRARFDNADKLMSDRAFETSITASDFEIRITNARENDADECFAFG